jgi:hypothetical protein
VIRLDSSAMSGRPTPTRGALRVCRGVVLAVTSAALAVAAHAVAGGGVPDAVSTVLLTIGVAVIGVAMASRRRSTGAILIVLGAAQLAMHLLLSFDTTTMPGMGMQVTGQAGPPFGGIAMLSAHALAAVLTAFLLAKADAAVFAVAAALARLLPTLLAAPPVTAGPARLRPGAAPRASSTAVSLWRDNARRGPPVAA